MQKLGFSGLMSLDHLRSLRGSAQGSSRATAAPLRTSDSGSHGSFTNLKLAAEKLVKEQASVKTNLEMAHVKLEKSADQIRTLEAKLQESSNENAKLQVKLKEDTKLWKGLDSKLSSTKTLSDQLTETLHHLAGQVREAEEDKKFFESKLSANVKAFEELHLQVVALSAKLDSAQEMVQSEKLEVMKLKVEKEEMEKRLGDELLSTGNLLKEKDVVIKQLEASVEEDRLSLESLNSQLKEMHLSLSLKDDVCRSLGVARDNLEKEKTVVESSNGKLAQELHTCHHEMKCLQDSVCDIKTKAIELDRSALHVWESYVRLSSTVDTFYNLIQMEKELKEKCSQKKFNHLNDLFSSSEAENNAFRSEIEELKNKVVELHKVQEFSMVQHAEECRLAEEKVRKMEHQVQELVSKKIELEGVISKLEAEIKHLLEISSLTDNQMQDLLMKASRLELEKQNIQDQMQATLKEKSEEVDSLQKLLAIRDQDVVSLQSEIDQISATLNEKDQLILESNEKEKHFEQTILEMQASLATAESTLKEASSRYELSLQGKDLELSKHLNEISQRNDQAINEIRRKFEVEKLEIVNLEREKAEKLVGEFEKNCNEKVAQTKEEASQRVKLLEEEHHATINQIQQEHEKKDSSLKARHVEELQRIELQAESELRQMTLMIRNEHEAQISSLKHQHEDELQQLKEHLELQRSKEDKQRALLKMQWKVMGENQQEDVEVNSKKEHSVSSIKMREAEAGKMDQLGLKGQVNLAKDEKYQGVMQTPMAKILKKVDRRNPGSIINIPKHSKKVTHHEYEVETSNGRTIKRRKTKSTVMFGDPAEQKMATMKTPKSGKDVVNVRRVTRRTPRASSIGDLFSEGSLNPYADDPYAFN